MDQSAHEHTKPKPAVEIASASESPMLSEGTVPFYRCPQGPKSIDPIYLHNLYAGAPAFLICGGPSFGRIPVDERAWLDEPGMLTMAVNNAARTFRPNLWTHADAAGKFLRSVWLDPTIMKFVPRGRMGDRLFNSDAMCYMDQRVIDCPNVLAFNRGLHFEADTYLTCNPIAWGCRGCGGKRSVMLAAVRLLYELGVRTLFLLGVDLNMTETETYHFKQARHPGSVSGNMATYKVLRKVFGLLRPNFEAAGFQVYNCNPESHLPAFDYVPFSAAIEHVRGAMQQIDVDTERTEGMYDELPLPPGPQRRQRRQGRPTGQRRRKRRVVVPGEQQIDAMMEEQSVEPMPARVAFDPIMAEPLVGSTVRAEPPDPVFLVTPTGDRPEAFALCERWIANQTYDKPFGWIVVDDGEHATECTMAQTVIRRPRAAGEPKNTLPLNLALALEQIDSYRSRCGKVLIIEDDDWYSPGYVALQVEHLADEAVHLVGQSNALYYRVDLPAFKCCHNRNHASLAATAFKYDALGPQLHDWCLDRKNWTRFIDKHLWAACTAEHKRLSPESLEKPALVQMKAMIGRPGTTRSHTAMGGYISDPGYARLQTWIGDDVEAYLDLAEGIHPDTPVAAGEHAEQPDPRPRILVTASALGMRDGSSVAAAVLVNSLRDMGCIVDTWSPRAGELSRELGGAVTLDKLEARGANYYRAAFCSHTDTCTVVKDLGVAPMVVQTIHGIHHDLEKVAPGMDAYVAVSDEVERSLQNAVDAPIRVIRNAVDLHRFTSRHPISPDLRRVAFLSNHNYGEAAVQMACKKLSLAYVRIGGKKSNMTKDMPAALNSVDLVVTVGRGAIEAMACERLVIIYDQRPYQSGMGGMGYVRDETRDECKWSNYSGRPEGLPNGVPRQETPEVADWLMRAMRHYDVGHGAILREWVREHHDAADQARAYLDLIGTATTCPAEELVVADG